MTTSMKPSDFEEIYYPDGTCTNWYCGKPGVVLAYDDFSPEVAHWFCEQCWQEVNELVDFLDVVEDKRKG